MLRKTAAALDAAIRGLGVVALGVAAVFIALLAAVGTADIIGTSIFASPVPSALEISQASLVIVVFMGLAYAQRRRAHIAVDIVSARFRGTVRSLSVGLTLLAALACFSFLAWRSGTAAAESVAIDERSLGLTRFPVYPAKIALCLGCIAAALESLRQLVHLCMGRPDPEKSQDGRNGTVDRR